MARVRRWRRCVNAGALVVGKEMLRVKARGLESVGAAIFDEVTLKSNVEDIFEETTLHNFRKRHGERRS